MREPHAIWLLRLVPGGRHGRLVAGTVIFLVLMAAYAATGMFDGVDTAEFISPEVAVFFCVIVAYIVPVFHYITHLTAAAARDLAPVLPDSRSSEELAQRIIGQSPFNQLLAAGTGLGAGLMHHFFLSGSVSRAIDGMTRDAKSAALAVGTLVVWTFLTAVIFALVRNARLFSTLGATVRIDLLRTRAYTPFARVAVSSTLALIGAQAAFPIMWIDPDVSAIAMVPGLIATTIAMVFLFVLPLISIHRAIAAAKRAEVARLDDTIGRIAAELPARHDNVRLAQLNPLLSFRREIEAVSEWPFDTSVSGRLALYLIIPPLTWVGAALIEMLIDDLV